MSNPEAAVASVMGGVWWVGRTRGASTEHRTHETTARRWLWWPYAKPNSVFLTSLHHLSIPGAQDMMCSTHLLFRRTTNTPDSGSDATGHRQIYTTQSAPSTLPDLPPSQTPRKALALGGVRAARQ